MFLLYQTCFIQSDQRLLLPNISEEKESPCLILQINQHKSIFFLKYKRAKSMTNLDVQYLSSMAVEVEKSPKNEFLKTNQHMELTVTEQDQIQFNIATQEIHLKFQIHKAKLNGTKLELLLVIQRFTFEGPIETKIVQQRQWLIDFYLKEANINLQNGFFCPRIEPGLAQESGNIAANVLLICGIDLLQTHAIINKYSKQNPQVAWIDASHCKLTFQNEQLVQQFLSNQLVNKEDIQQFPLKDWVQTQGYVFLNEFKRKVYVRNYTQRDLTFIDAIEKNDAIYQNFKRANKELEYNLLKHQKTRMIFQQSVVEGIVHQMIGPNAFRKKKKQTIEKMAQDRSNFIQSRNNPKAYVQRHKSCPRKEASFQSQQNHKQQVNLPVQAQQMVDQKSRYSLEYYKKVFIPDLINNNLNKIKPKNKTDLTNEYIPEPVNISEKILEKKKRAHAEYKNKTMEKILSERNFHTLIHEIDLLSKEEYQKFHEKAKRKAKTPQKVEYPKFNASFYLEPDTSFHFDQAPSNHLNDQQNYSYEFKRQMEVVELPNNPQKSIANERQKNSFHHFNSQQQKPQGKEKINYQNYFMAPKKRSVLRNYNGEFQLLTQPRSLNQSSVIEKSNEHAYCKSASNHHSSLDQIQKMSFLSPFQNTNSFQIANDSRKIPQNNQSDIGFHIKTSVYDDIPLPSDNLGQADQKETQGKDIFQKLQSIKMVNPLVFLQSTSKAEWPFKPIPANPVNNKEPMSFLNK